MPKASEGTEEGLKPLSASSHAKSLYSFHTQYNTGNIQEGFDGWCSMVEYKIIATYFIKDVNWVRIHLKYLCFARQSSRCASPVALSTIP